MGCSGSVQTVETLDALQLPRGNPGTPHIFHQRYQLMQKLGRGAFAQVYRIQETTSSPGSTGTSYAVKVIDLRKVRDGKPISEINLKMQLAVEIEVVVLREVGTHAHCIKVLEHFVDDSFAYIVMELCDKSLYKALDALPVIGENTLARIAKEVLLGLAWVHGRRIVHRDVKPDNYLCLAEGTVKLCDFGLAEKLRNEGNKLFGSYGTVPFMCPEMLEGQGYDYKADIWSAGVMLYVMLLGEFPYQPAECSSKAMKALILSGDPAPSYKPSPGVLKKFDQAAPGGSSSGLIAEHQEVVARAKGLIKKLLSRNPADRPMAAQVLEDSWLQKASDSQLNLRAVFEASLRVGAFDTRKLPHDTSAGSMDDMLQKHQALYNRNHKGLVPNNAGFPKETRTKPGVRAPPQASSTFHGVTIVS